MAENPPKSRLIPENLFILECILCFIKLGLIISFAFEVIGLLFSFKAEFLGAHPHKFRI